MMKVLALSPHMDDAEYGAGGFIAKLVADGHKVRVVAFSYGHTLKGAYDTEYYAAMGALGVQRDDCFFWGGEARILHEHRQEILNYLTRPTEWVPDLVLCPSRSEYHQDHEVIYKEAVRAFRKCSILGYHIPWSSRGFRALFYVPLSVVEVNRKIDALKCYRSQWIKRHYMTEKGVEAILTMRGDQIGVPWAEAFEVIRWIF